jgi:hypothetical protein
MAIALLPHGIAMNSPGHPVWDTSESQFGPYQGQMFIGDQSQSNIFRVAIEEINGIEQAALLPFMSNTASGAMRLRFNPIDNSMWIGQTGRGWWAKGGNLSALQKISWDKKTIPQSIHSINVHKTGFVVNFTRSVDKSQRSSYQQAKLSSWYYSEDVNYGSNELGKRDEALRQHTWSKDGKQLTLELADFVLSERAPTSTSRVYQLDFSDTALKQEVGDKFHTIAWYTLNTIPQ